jgi:hypothetical protein
MRAVAAISFGAIIALVNLPGPSHATGSQARSAEVAATGDEASSRPPCYSYEQNPDGSWKQTACQEIGAPAPQKAASQSPGKKASR